MAIYYTQKLTEIFATCTRPREPRDTHIPPWTEEGAIRPHPTLRHCRLVVCWGEEAIPQKCSLWEVRVTQVNNPTVLQTTLISAVGHKKSWVRS